jgi:hypothetical protein
LTLTYAKDVAHVWTDVKYTPYLNTTQTQLWIGSSALAVDFALQGALMTLQSFNESLTMKSSIPLWTLGCGNMNVC